MSAEHLPSKRIIKIHQRAGVGPIAILVAGGVAALLHFASLLLPR